ncbi:hypothetical protein F4776DRAFT_497026 [Hypoxylon sp. NC0597]|nr:hypothetical protein F4776DRAFT_497026 [Hypoxylon sp. NC0597]
MPWPTVSFIDPVIRWFGRKQIPKFYQELRKMIGRRMSMPKAAAHDLYEVASGDVTPSGRQGSPGHRLVVRGVFLRYGRWYDCFRTHERRFCQMFHLIDKEPSSPAGTSAPSMTRLCGSPVGVSPYSVLHNKAYFPVPRIWTN